MRIEKIEGIEDKYKFRGKKRQYLPFKLYWVCPECEEERVHSFKERYMSYPEWGEPEEVHLFCGECGFEKTVEVTPELSMEFGIEVVDDAE